MIWSFLTEAEPTLEVNETQLKFRKTGDLEISTGRHFIQRSQLTLVNTPDEASYINAYSRGEKVFKRFVLVQELFRMWNQARQVAEDIQFDQKYAAVVHMNLNSLRSQLVLLATAIDPPSRLAADPEDGKDDFINPNEQDEVFQLSSQRVQKVLRSFLAQPEKAFLQLSPEAKLRERLGQAGIRAFEILRESSTESEVADSDGDPVEPQVEVTVEE